MDAVVLSMASKVAYARNSSTMCKVCIMSTKRHRRVACWNMERHKTYNLSKTREAK